MDAGLSIVIPAYNAEKWLEPTIEKLYAAILHAKITQFEVIIINDGSSDQTLSVAHAIAIKKPNITVHTQANKGRFITRKRGVSSAKYGRIFFLDARVWIDETALTFLADQLDSHPERKVWNGHINVAKKGNIIARFGDALTLIGWRRYFRRPRLISYGVEDFDYYPKGTGLFSCTKNTIVEAMKWFEANTTDLKNSSDDTLLIRRISTSERIWLSPQFSATYFARTTLSAFMSHSYHRGQFFVDGFLRKGTRFYYPLIAFLLLTPLVLLLIILYPFLIFGLLLVWVIGFVVAFLLGLAVADSLSLFVLAPLFVVTYGMGIWKAIIRKIMLR